MGNPVVHVELIGPDPARLREFYSALFGWDAPAGAPVAPAISASADYAFITPEPGWGPAAGGIGGGAGFAPHSIFYVGVESVSDALQAAQELGGTVVLVAPAALEHELVPDQDLLVFGTRSVGNAPS